MKSSNQLVHNIKNICNFDKCVVLVSTLSGHEYIKIKKILKFAFDNQKIVVFVPREIDTHPWKLVLVNVLPHPSFHCTFCPIDVFCKLYANYDLSSSLLLFFRGNKFLELPYVVKGMDVSFSGLLSFIEVRKR